MLRRALLGIALLSSLAAPAFAASAEAPSDVLRITLDQAKVAKVPTGTSTLVVGNPGIADVTMLKGGVGMVVTGRGYGQTNLVAIDADGMAIAHGDLAGLDARGIQRGLQLAEAYHSRVRQSAGAGK